MSTEDLPTVSNKGQLLSTNTVQPNLIVNEAPTEECTEDVAIRNSLYNIFTKESKQLKCHSIILLTICMLVLIWFMFAVLIYDILPSGHIDTYEYGISEFLANAMIILLSLCIWWRYLYRATGNLDYNDCTNFDLYAILSLLWLLTTTILFLVFSEFGLSLLQLVRMFALIIPGYIHKFYIRYTTTANISYYLGDIKLYKIIIIIFYVIQLIANVVQIPLNQEWFDQTVTRIFSLDNAHQHYHLPFIIAAVFGRPFLSMLLFHSLVLYVTWLMHGDKPKSYHDQDAFSLWYEKSELNINVGLITIVLFIFDLTLHKYAIYDILFLIIYMSIAIFILFYSIYNICYVDKKLKSNLAALTKQIKRTHKIDKFEIFESSFVLIAGLIAICCYSLNIHDYIHEYSAWSKLFGWASFMISQYILIIYLQFDYNHKLNLDVTQRILQFSGMISAISIMYCFLFEYDHFLDILSDEHDTASNLLRASYSLFWCLIEYFIWSFVTVNHMLHQQHTFINKKDSSLSSVEEKHQSPHKNINLKLSVH
eukprot:335868_1